MGTALWALKNFALAAKPPPQPNKVGNVINPFYRGINPGLENWPKVSKLTPTFFSFKDLINLFLEREEGRKREEGRNIDCCLLNVPQRGTGSLTQACALLGIEPVTFCFGDDAQPTEPHRSGLKTTFLTSTFFTGDRHDLLSRTSTY